MKRLMAATASALLLTACAGAAFAQSGPPANPNASTPAVASKSTTNPGAPAAGANSFTEGQAKSRIEAAGYTNVSGLMKDKDGIWRGTATKGSATNNVALDFQGNVVTNQGNVVTK
jgi:predicted homoserine dehydrogenase-like protein